MITDLNVPVLRGALCAGEDPELWQQDIDNGGRAPKKAPARKICLACPVRQACLEWALDTDQRWGIWGGLDPRQRKKLKGRK